MGSHITWSPYYLTLIEEPIGEEGDYRKDGESIAKRDKPKYLVVNKVKFSESEYRWLNGGYEILIEDIENGKYNYRKTKNQGILCNNTLTLKDLLAWIQLE